MLQALQGFLIGEGMRDNTIGSYLSHTQEYINWYKESFGKDFRQLYRNNILDFISYQLNIKKVHPKTVNVKVFALIKYNEFLIKSGIQNDMVASKKDTLKVQAAYASPSTICKKDVENFRQQVLEGESKRDYAIVTIMAYAGLRISEVLNLQEGDVNIPAKELIVKSGKGNKQRIVYLNDKIINAVKGYLLEKKKTGCPYLLISRTGNKLNRTRINQIFNKYSNIITPHTLRHFYCSNALESGYSVHEVANQAGHSNIHTTLIYTNPDKNKMKAKANLL